jgi:hypothetical protein
MTSYGAPLTNHETDVARPGGEDVAIPGRRSALDGLASQDGPYS